MVVHKVPECFPGEPIAKKKKLKQQLRKTNAVYRQSDEEEEHLWQPVKLKRDRSITCERDDADDGYYHRRLRLVEK